MPLFFVDNRFYLVGSYDNIGYELFIHDTETDLPIAAGCRQTQSIVFERPPDLIEDGLSISLHAVSTSGLPVSFAVSNSNATVTENMLQPKEPGQLTVTARQAGNNSFEPAEEVQHTICVDPAKPIISVEGSVAGITLTSSNDRGNQWFRNGETLPGEVSQNLDVFESGLYTVSTEIEGCSSLVSDAYDIVITGVNSETGENDTKIYPTITSDIVVLEFAGAEVRTVQILTSFGILLKELSIDKESMELSMGELATGIYLIRINSADGHLISKVIRQ